MDVQYGSWIFPNQFSRYKFQVTSKKNEVYFIFPQGTE
uniref:Uncharacterized protein n=1 Tax=Arundo donax TaxID=35708 RepID=A0A0A9G6Z0_ARUDO